jgi:hypothetical protein
VRLITTEVNVVGRVVVVVPFSSTLWVDSIDCFRKKNDRKGKERAMKI